MDVHSPPPWGWQFYGVGGAMRRRDQGIASTLSVKGVYKFTRRFFWQSDFLFSAVDRYDIPAPMPELVTDGQPRLVIQSLLV